ncbi:tetratricopeptide repeat protein [Halomonas sp. G11]|uniref:tetratricopeptide repeat protein n=1 Tax=Halomonas sp. G11 TaxID=1684425 RepID=UPI0009EE4C79|nr:tetratricopeptide repeat protein [Halomonas sp. G11]
MRLIMTMVAGLTLTFLLQPAWALDDEAQAAKDEGMRLYNAHQRSISTPYLEKAAEAGDSEAMYYLGEVNRLRHMGMNQAALDWYYQAAQHGDPHAMLRLFDGGACELGDVCPENGDDWPQAAFELTLPKAKAGDPEAMAALYDIYYYVKDPDEDEAMKWLRRAAEAGHVESMNLLGEIARNNEEGYDNDTERLEAAEVWFRKAAEAGYAPAMNNLASVLNHLDQPEEAWEWITKASEAGHINGRGWLAACSIEPDGEGMNLCRAAPDPEPAKGWAILRAMNEEVPGTSSERLLRVYGENVTPEQREEGEEMVDEWLNREPPLSYFPDKFGP